MWHLVALFVASFAIAFFTASRRQSGPPTGIGNVKAPTAEEGREIPVLFGTRDLEAPNVVWWGDIKTVPIKAKGGKK